MSETEIATTEAPVTTTETVTPTESTSEPTTTETTPSKPAGYAPIDPVTATPEQTKERLDYLYSQVKHSDREKKEMRKILSDQSRVIDELSKGQQIVVNHLTQKSVAESKEQLKASMQEAWKKGDERSYIEAQTKLQELQVQEQFASQKPQPQPNGHIPNSAAKIAEGAVQTGELSDTDYRTTESWQNEKDESGNLLRSWAFDSDPAYTNALYEARAVLSNSRYQNWTYEQKLAEVDRRMGTTKRTASQAVMGGNLTKPTKSTKIELSPKQREIALKSKYAGKGKSEADHLEAFRKQLEKFQQRRAK